MTGPMVGADVWRAVVTAAGGHCECTGQCGLAHRKDRGRCRAEDADGSPLHAVPRQPAAEVEAMRLPPGELLAVCDDCHGRMLALWRKREREAARLRLRLAPDLFAGER